MTAPENFEQMVADIQRDAFDIMIERHRKYGPHNITRHGLTGVVVRAADKLARLENLTINNRGAAADDETVEDTLLDLMNYALIGLAVRRGLWTPAHCPPLAGNQAAPPGDPIAYVDRDGDKWYREKDGNGWRWEHTDRADGSCAHMPIERLAEEYGPLAPLP